MRRFFIQKSDILERWFHFLDRDSVNYMRNILRIEPGDKIELFDGEGSRYIAHVNKVTKEKVTGEIEETFAIDEPATKLTLGQTLPKAGKLDDIVRMNTEVGVQKFVLFESEYSQVKEGKYTEQKLDRLRRVTVEASRQSERLFLPQIELIGGFAEAVSLTFENKIILHARHDDSDSVDLSELKSDVVGKNTLLLIGPEGGFSPKEIELAIKHGFTRAHMNLPILRTETAGLVASAILLS